MTTETPERLDLSSLSIADDRLARLREDFPEVFREGKVDFDALRRSLGDWVDPGKERFGLNWPGKGDLMRIIQQPSVGTLVPMLEESVDFDTTQNMIIEGDNLEVLKLLQKSYYGKVKMIYIDPPYNTGNDFIYPDNFTEGLQDYLRYSGQVDGDGLKLSTNTESEGRYHSKWLSMMYPRLFLARNLLRDDGVIFVSIDDHEMHNLRALMNDLFGEENFLACLARRTKSGGGSAAHHFAVEHDYILVFGRSRDFTDPLFVPHDEDYARRYSETDSNGRFFWDTMQRSYTQTKPYKITAPDGTLLNGKWFRSEERFLQDLHEGEVRFLRKEDNSWSVQFKQRMAEGRKIRSLLYENSYKSTHDEIDALGMDGAFAFPKPTSLIGHLVQAACKDGELVLDFFAGSGTMGHAVMKLNADDGGNRRFILVQLPEPTDGAFPTIASITRERVRRTGAAIAKERAGTLNLAGQGMLDLGFRAYKLTTSNFKPWDGDPARFSSDAQQQGMLSPVARQLEIAADNVLPRRTGEDILAEVLLKAGFELTEPTERLTLAGKEVFSVAEGALLVCLDRNLTLDVIEAMVARDPGQVVCLDVGFKGNDQLKVNAVQTIKTRARSQESAIEFKVV